MSVVLINVGCLECNEYTELLGVYADETIGGFELRKRVRAMEPRPPVYRADEIDGAGPTLIMAAGWGGSYWYPLQLHRGAA